MSTLILSELKEETMSEQLKREQCTRCAVKHLGQARALMLETKKGYPHHIWYAMGHMAEAEDEISEIQPECATMIRESRVKLEDQLKHSTVENFNGEMPDFKKLMYAVAEDGMLEETL